ncbi:hypothetical protein SEPCBS119000_004251 [Sporothrix epigloea]|uniref:Uncharacterized protein n=1 Tax=Sporothrix epigloea TaxID=1892477 RepID=A0ABP0DUZ4_9PEZI
MKFTTAIVLSSLALTVIAAPATGTTRPSLRLNDEAASGMVVDRDAPAMDATDPFHLPNGQSEGGQGPVGLNHHHHWWEETADAVTEDSH